MICFLLLVTAVLVGLMVMGSCKPQSSEGGLTDGQTDQVINRIRDIGQAVENIPAN